jgi:hypothetical protein
LCAEVGVRLQQVDAPEKARSGHQLLAFALQHAPPAKLNAILEAAKMAENHLAENTDGNKDGVVLLARALGGFLGDGTSAEGFPAALRRASEGSLALAGEALEAAKRISLASLKDASARTPRPMVNHPAAAAAVDIFHAAHPAYACPPSPFPPRAGEVCLRGNAYVLSNHKEVCVGDSDAAQIEKHLHAALHHAVTVPQTGRGDALVTLKKALLDIAAIKLSGDLPMAISCIITSEDDNAGAALVQHRAQACQGWRAGQYVAALALAHHLHARELGCALIASVADVLAWAAEVVGQPEADTAGAAPWKKLFLGCARGGGGG